jgi:predicted enzyme related to lactoylglutathione lyase
MAARGIHADSPSALPAARAGGLSGTLAWTMGERTSYTPGTFCWSELSTTDLDGAKAFYAGLFGWEPQDNPVPGGGVYSMQTIARKPVAAIAPQPQQQREAGVPSMWNSYVSVESADATAEKAKDLGAQVHAPPFDVMDVGRMAVIQDPQGAFFMLWQPRTHVGAALVNAPGALVWNELRTPDLDGSEAFYTELFGWTISRSEGTPLGTYLGIKNGDSNNGGIAQASPPGTPPHWLVYFGVEDVDAALARVAQLGGSTLLGATDIGIAKIAVVRDPQGAAFAIYAGRLEP